MKRFSVAIVFFLAFASILALTKEEARERWENINRECNSDPATALDTAAAKKWMEQGGEKPENMGPHAHCMCKKLGWQNEAGEIMMEDMKKSIVEGGVPADKADALMNKCAVAKDTKEDTADGMIGCIMSTVDKHEKND